MLRRTRSLILAAFDPFASGLPLAAPLRIQTPRRVIARPSNRQWAWLHWCILIACSIANPGCTVCQNFKRTIWHEPAAYSWKHDRRLSVEIYREWAQGAWLEAARECPDMLGDNDYALGFRDGFVDYVYAGGNGEPPPVPPRHYWNVMLRSQEGKQQANQWFAGYRHGAQYARNGGYRELGVIRTSLVAEGEPFEQSSYPPQLAEPYGLDVYSDGSQTELIPEPRTTPNLPALPAPHRPSTDGASAADLDRNLSTPPEVPHTEATPSIGSPTTEGDPTEQPDDMFVPAEEPLGDPFQSDGAYHPVPPRGPQIESASTAPRNALRSGPIRLASAVGHLSTSELAGSTIRVPDEPIHSAKADRPEIVVTLVPTPAGHGAPVEQQTQPSVTARVQLTSANEDEELPSEASTSTIRVRSEPDHYRRVPRPLAPTRKPSFLR
jgi:hypothetical protein